MACMAASAISSLGTTTLLWHRLSVTARQSSMPLSKNDCHVNCCSIVILKTLPARMLGMQMPVVYPFPDRFQGFLRMSDKTSGW